MPDNLGLPSTDVVLGAVERQQDQQRAHFESLDSKAGIALGFAGAIAALARDVRPVVAKVGVALAVLAAAFAMLSFRPRKLPIFDPMALRRYLRAEKELTPAPPTGHADRDGAAHITVDREEGTLALRLARDARARREPHGRRYAVVVSADQGQQPNPEPAPATEPPPPPPYDPDISLITDLERGLRRDSPGVERR